MTPEAIAAAKTNAQKVQEFETWFRNERLAGRNPDSPGRQKVPVYRDNTAKLGYVTVATWLPQVPRRRWIGARGEA